VFDLMLRVALQKPADWTPLQAQLDPSADLIQTAHIHSIGGLIKQESPHPLFIQDTEP